MRAVWRAGTLRFRRQHRLPASEPATARAGAGDEDKGPRLAGLLSRATFGGGLYRHAIHPWRADAGRPAGKK